MWRDDIGYPSGGAGGQIGADRSRLDFSNFGSAVDALRPRVPFHIYDQRDLPKTALVQAFANDESSCLFATAGFFSAAFDTNVTDVDSALPKAPNIGR